MKAIDDFLMRRHYPQWALRAVFFDMDGVLFDSMPYHAYAWSKTFRNHGFEFSEYDAYLNEGRTGEAVIDEYFLKTYGRHATKAESDTLYAEKGRYFIECGTVNPVPHIQELLREVKAQGLDIYIVTGSAQRSLLDTLNTYFPDIFVRTKMVTAFDVKHGKPDPEPYLTALRKAAIEPWQALVVENAPLGVQAAVAAGIFTVAVNTGILLPQVLHDAGADIVLPSMAELIDLLPCLITNS
ncbi:MAG: HAD family hydrolase [Paludibacteraceae bacterium]